MRTDLYHVLDAIRVVQTELYQANKLDDKLTIIECSDRLTTLIRCLDVEAVMDELEKVS